MDKSGRRIAIACPQHARQNYGGGEILLDKTVAYLKSSGAQVKLFDPWNDRLEDFDILHFFGIGYFNYEFMRVAKAKGIKIVLTPILPLAQGLEGLKRSIYHKGCLLLPFLKTPALLMKYNALLADVIAVSSLCEKERLVNDFCVPPGKMKMVRYGADSGFLAANGGHFISEYGIKDFVLCVGRFDSRQKNQLNLVRALKGTGIPCVFVGKPDSGMQGYYRQCRSEGSDCLFIDYLNQESMMLASAYAACRTFAVPSKFEYPGLAAMEAALSGCKRLALTKFGCTREYYGDFASYFDPYSVKDIRRVLLAAHAEENPDPGIRDYFKKNFLWENYVQELIKVYEAL